jgi:hypothetical protein
MSMLHGSIAPSRNDERFPEKHDEHLHPSADLAQSARVLPCAGHREPSRHGSDALRENDGIDLIIVSEEFPAKPGEPKRPPGFLFAGARQPGQQVTTMNAMIFKPPWRPWVPARRMKLKQRQYGFAALVEEQRRPGLPVRVANAQARFEHEARLAMREWLML